METRIIRSSRKTLAIEVTPEAVIVRAPKRASEARIRRFLAEQEDWIAKAVAKAEAQREAALEAGAITDSDLQELTKAAKEYIPERVAYYAPLVGVDYGRITIRHQKSRWGSCSAKGNLNFNCLLMMCPPEVIDSVVVHELCHRLEMNHSERFYAHVRRVYPEYDQWNRWLKRNGKVLMLQAFGNQ